MRCKNCTHYDVCYQYDIIGEDDNEMCALYEQKRPHGEWEQVGEMTYKCTKCGWLKKIGLMPFCENCGADMRNPKDDLAEIIEAVQSIREGEQK